MIGTSCNHFSNMFWSLVHRDRPYNTAAWWQSITFESNGAGNIHLHKELVQCMRILKEKVAKEGEKRE